MLKKTFLPKSNEMREDWKRLHTGEHHSLDFLTNIIGVTKSRIV